MRWYARRVGVTSAPRPHFRMRADSASLRACTIGDCMWRRGNFPSAIAVLTLAISSKLTGIRVRISSLTSCFAVSCGASACRV